MKRTKRKFDRRGAVTVELALVVPVFIALLVPIRAMLPRFFDKDHLAFLDADEDPEEEGSHWV